jgi:hypothetical protein
LKPVERYIIRGTRAKLEALYQILKDRGFDGTSVCMRNGKVALWMLDSEDRGWDYFSAINPAKHRHYVDAIEGQDVELTSFEEVERLLKEL